MSQSGETLGILAGRGRYPELVAEGARSSGVRKIVTVAFEGETDSRVTQLSDEVIWLRVGQLGKCIRSLKRHQVHQVMMAGQIQPGRLFDLKPDLTALRLLFGLKERNAETLFGAVTAELSRHGIEVLPAIRCVESYLAGVGHLAGPRPDRQLFRDIELGWPVLSRLGALQVGQCVVVKKGTVLAVEGYDGTDATIRRGGALGGGKATLLKGTRPGQDFRFDVPVIGRATLRTCAEAGIARIVLEGGRTLILDRDEVMAAARKCRICLFGYTTEESPG